MNIHNYDTLKLIADDLKAQMEGLEKKWQSVQRQWIEAELKANEAKLCELSESELAQDKQDRHADYLRDRDVDRAA